MSRRMDARWPVAGASALMGGVACVLLINADFPYGVVGFLLFPVFAVTVALVILLTRHGAWARFPAAASTGYCVTAIVSWLWGMQVFTCSSGVTALMLRLSRGRYRPTSCSWGPDGLLAFALPATLVMSVVVLIFGIHRQKDSLSWGIALAVFCTFAFQALWTSRLSPVRGWEFPGWVSLVLLLCCLLAITVGASWRAGRRQ